MRLKLLIAAATLLVSPMAGATELIQNGSFTTGDFTGWTLFTTPNGSTGPALVSSFDVTGTGAQNAATFNVGQGGVFVQGQVAGGGIYQDITTTAGLLSFSAAIAFLSPNINGSDGDFSVLLDGTVVETFSFPGGIRGTVVRDTLAFTETVTAGVHQLEILITRPAGQRFGITPNDYITDISAQQQVAAVPEPATWAMMLLGFTGLGFVARRRRSRPGLMAA